MCGYEDLDRYDGGAAAVVLRSAQSEGVRYVSEFVTSSGKPGFARWVDSHERERVPEQLRIAATLAVVAMVHGLGFGLPGWAQWSSAADAVTVGLR